MSIFAALLAATGIAAILVAVITSQTASKKSFLICFYIQMNIDYQQKKKIPPL
jgi:hypothetical protein